MDALIVFENFIATFVHYRIGMQRMNSHCRRADSGVVA